MAEEKRVPAIIKVKAALAIGLPVLFVGLIGLGFVPMLEDGDTLWKRVGRKFFGGEDSRPMPVRRNEPVRVDNVDINHFKDILNSGDRGQLMGAGMDVEELIREIGNSEDPKLADLKKQLETVLADIQKKLAATAPPKPKDEIIIPSGKSK
jgi:hypothetical protein